MPDRILPSGTGVPACCLQFMATLKRRARYWARSFAGWHEFRDVRPNRAHEALARLQHNGWVHALITQNVDRLHHKAGSRDVIELHGTTHRCSGLLACWHRSRFTLSCLCLSATICQPWLDQKAPYRAMQVVVR